MLRNRYLISFILICILLVTTGCGLLSKGKDLVEDAISDNGEGKAEESANTEKGAVDEVQANAEQGDYQIALGGEIEETENQFIVHGTSNLIPGSRIVGEIVVDEGETIFSDTSEIVQDDGSFYMELEHHQFGEAEIIIRFDFDNVQDEEVVRHYGEKGQKLEGPFIYRHKTYDGILQKAEAKLDYKPNETNELVIAPPDWEELPDDFGDPRVWIEVDELTEDGEFFYMHGRSNIMEGSEINVEYQYNRDKTTVNPDGTFDFKFDYEYLEDKDIVITFEPSAYQWNEIEEAYGKTGQKLVGNLVKTSKFNKDKQFIEKRIEWDSEASEMKSGNVNQTRDEDTDKDTEKEKQEDDEPSSDEE